MRRLFVKAMLLISVPVARSQEITGLFIPMSDGSGVFRV